jgi:type I restriction enzyme, R subunit
MTSISEDDVEQAALGWLRELGYAHCHGPDIAPDGPSAERASNSDVVLVARLRDALRRLNPDANSDALEDAARKVLLVDGPNLIEANRRFHAMLANGVEVEYRRPDGSTAGDRLRLADFDDPDANDWLAVNQFAVSEGQHARRPDIVLFLNGLPIAVFELKNAASETASIRDAFNQLQTYKQQIPSLFRFNEFLVISDGLHARTGSLSANWEWFKIWRTIDGEKEERSGAVQLGVLIRGMFDRRNVLGLIRNFVTFESDDKGRTSKVIAGYHQFHAVNVAVEQTMRAASAKGDRRVGVVWHTQGSGKSFSMLFYAGAIARSAAMENPTVVVLTDRNDLDQQLYGQFLRCQDTLGQTPVQADSRAKLRELLRVASGGVVFTTIQKFMPEEKGDRMPCLSDRRNIVVIADEAHRSQYDLIDGLARHLRDAVPNASFIGFTGTPIEKTDANTRAVFGDYVSIYDIQQAVADGATVPIYYESRIAKLGLLEAELPRIDEEFEEITEGEEEETRQRLKTRWAALEALVGDPKRLEIIAKDLVAHFERRQEILPGKAMVVCMSRRICIDLLDAILKLRPDWAGDPNDDPQAEAGKQCVAKIVMTGSASDKLEWQPHIRSKPRRGELALRFKDPSDPFRIVIVRDMWLTGYDAPCLHTMYVDKPMRGHGLMQAIARVNRVFRDKPGGLVVDYLGLAEQLKEALSTYTESGGRGSTSEQVEQAVEVLVEKVEVARGMLHGFDWTRMAAASGPERLAVLAEAEEHVLGLEDGKRRFVTVVTEISRAFALCATHETAIGLRDEIGFYQTVQSALRKLNHSERDEADLDHAIKQLVSSAVTTHGEVIDVFAAAGLQKPDISILSEEFLREVKGMKHKNLAAEVLATLLAGEIKAGFARNVVKSRQFSEMLKKTLNAYHNRAVTSQEVIEELMRLTRELRASKERGERLGLSPQEEAFYDALADNESAVLAMGDPKLRIVAQELVTAMRKNTSVDWTIRESVRARIRVVVKKILKTHGFPPDLQDAAVKLVLEQAESLCRDWAGE